MADTNRRPRSTLLSPVNRRRPRSPSQSLDDATDTAGSATIAGRSRRPKRRRVDFETPAAVRPVKYGHFGQVEPGRLKLELVSCDGGEHMDSRHPGLYLGPKNLLQHNKSVYCSDRPSSNIILKHVDDTPFCLEKLHVVGPEHGFTAPVREGLVYVAMTLHDLQKYIDPPVYARRSGVNTPPYRRRRDPRDLHSSPERLTLSDALRDPEVNAEMGRREQDYARGADSAHDLAPAQDSYYGEDFGFGRTDPEAPCEIPTLLSSDAPDVIVNAEGDHVPVTVLSDEDVGPEEASSQEVLDYRLNRLRLMRRRYEVESWDRDERWSGLDGLRFDANDPDRDSSNSLSRLDQLMARSRVHDSPQPHDGPASLPAHAPNSVGTQGVEHDADRDENVTCARFHIKREKHKVAIRFEPAISGRFILLKLWANRGNVDVQSVIAKGYGSCRFFPARTAA